MGNVLVTGSCGQLGTELRLLTRGRKSFLFTDAVPSEGVAALDICDPAAVEAFCVSHRVKAIVNCAA